MKSFSRGVYALAIGTVACLLIFARLVGAYPFTTPAAEYLVGTDFTFCLVSGDFNGDTYPDFAATCGSDDDVKVLLNDGDGTFASAVSYSLPATGSAASVGLFDTDDTIDIAVVTDTGAIVFLFNNGDGTFDDSSPLTYSPTGTSPTDLETADLDGGSKDDLISANVSGGPSALLTRLLNNDDGTFTSSSFSPSNIADVRLVVSGNFDNTNNDDLWVGDEDGRFVILLNDGDGTSFTESAAYDIGGKTWGHETADFNEDGYDDLVFASGGSAATIRILLNDGDGTFPASATTVYDGGAEYVTYFVVPADLDDDSNIDLAFLAITAAFDAQEVFTMLGNGDGTFDSAVSLGLGLDYNEYASEIPGEDPIAANFNGGAIDLAFLSNNYTTGDDSVLVLLADNPTPTPTPSTAAGAVPLGPWLNSASSQSPASAPLHEGDLISAPGSDDPDVYIVNEHGFKRLFLNPAIFGFYGHLGGFAQVRGVSPQVRDSFGTSGLFRNCEANDPKIYAVEVTGEDTGVLHHVNLSGAQAASEDPDFFRKVFCINTNEFNWYALGAPYTSLSHVPGYVRD